jgi:hypothetical protein
MFIGNHWQPLIEMGTFVSLVSTIMVIWVIESPRYLYSSGDIDKSNKAF